jgi:soluble lytic murein transglycosylase-like protein
VLFSFKRELLRRNQIVAIMSLVLVGSLPATDAGGVDRSSDIGDISSLLGHKSRKIKNIYMKMDGYKKSKKAEIKYTVARIYIPPKASFDPKKDVPSAEHGRRNDIRSIIATAERKHGIPEGLLMAIATIESKIRPYAVNISTKTYFCKSKEEAKRIINDAISSGRKNVSIGCLQLLYRAHNASFSGSIDSMLDPEKNIMYGAAYIKKLYKMYGSWEIAIKKYHSSIVDKAEMYYGRVMRIMHA